MIFITRFAKLIVRGLLTLALLVGLLLLAPILLPMALWTSMRHAWRRLVLWAVYDGDTAARDKDEWEHRP